MTSFAFDEDKVTAANPNPPVKQEVDNDEARDWDDIIPENFRRAVEDEERNKELEDLYLPPRRKTLQQINQTESTSGGERGKKRKKEVEPEPSEEESGGSETDQPKKRGRPPLREKIMNFTDNELRRFIRSYKKFPAPLKRLEAIACDAELQEKPLNELKKIAVMLRERCVTFLGKFTRK